MALFLHSTPCRPVCLFSLFAALLFSSLPAASPQSGRPREKLHDVLSRVPLSPPLRQQAALHFSPDGRFLLLQDSTGIFIISREPLAVLGHVDAPRVYGAIFSSDSQFLRIVGPSLGVSSWKLPSFLSTPNIDLPLKGGCLDARVSPSSEALACYRPDDSVQIYSLATGEELYADSPRKDSPLTSRTLLPLNTDRPYAGPIGFVMIDSLAPLADRRLLHIPMFFSPDGSDLLIAPNYSSSFHIDISSKKKTLIHGSLSKHKFTILSRLDTNRVLVVDPENKETSQIISLDTEIRPVSLPFSPDSARLADNSRFLLWRESSHRDVRVFDLQENRSVDVPPNIGLDISGNEVASYTESGTLFLRHWGEVLPYRSAPMPLSSLSQLNFASVDPALKRLAFSSADGGGVFLTDNGKPFFSVSLPKFFSASLAEPAFAWLALSETGQSPAQIEKLDFATGHVSSLTLIGKELYRSAGPVLAEYSFESPFDDRVSMISVRGGVSYRLRALDPTSGKELWKRTFIRGTPIPFPDPQGDRLVLGWNAKDDSAEEAASHFPAAKQIFKKAKRKEQDSFFEVLDVRSGKPLGGVLVQAGSGPSAFDLAFSTGDLLILSKDERRVSLYSLQNGTLLAHLVGEKPVTNAQTNLLALDASAGRLVLYDLRTGAKVDDQLFPDDIAYMQFSRDGKRLLVLTSHQLVFILSTEHPSVHPDSVKIPLP